MNIWKSLNCNFVDTLLKTKDISRKGLVFHVSKWILRKSISSPFLLDSSSFLYLLTIARFKINFQIKTIFFYFGKKIPSAMAISFLLLLTKVFILKEAHLVRYCDFVIFNYCKWQNLSTNY